MALPLEALRHEITPLGPHHLLTHHDIPMPRAGRLTVGGRLERPLLSLNDVPLNPQQTSAAAINRETLLRTTTSSPAGDDR